MQEPLNRCVMVLDFKEYFLKGSSAGRHGVGGHNVSQYQTQTIQVHTYIHILSVGIFKNQNHWFLLPKLYTFRFGRQPLVKANVRPRTICCGVSQWSKTHTAASWICVTPGTFVSCHLLPPVSPAVSNINFLKYTMQDFLVQKQSLLIIIYDPLTVCCAVFFWQDSALCLCFHIFCAKDVYWRVPHSRQVRSGLCEKVATRCQTVRSNHLRHTAPKKCKYSEAKHQMRVNLGLAFIFTLAGRCVYKQ